VDLSSPGMLPDKSGTLPSRLVWLKGGLVQIGFFSSTFDDCFEHNLLTISLIDLILLLMAS
jgi:hypothetical protein